MEEIKSFFKSSLNFITVVISILLSLSLWIIQPDDSVPSVYFVITTFLAAIFLWLFLMSFLKLLEYKHNHKEYDKLDNIEIIKFSRDICLCRENKLLSHESIVSFYFDEDGIETLIAYGVVINIQTTGLIQIQPHSIKNSIVCDETAIIDFITNNHAKIIVKPVITQTTIKCLIIQEVN